MDDPNKARLLKARNAMVNNIKNSSIPLPQLAMAAGISVKSLQNFIDGKTNTIRTPAVIKLSIALNMTLDEFLGMKDL